ncbi:MAG: bacteriocin [Caldimonas sp.]
MYEISESELEQVSGGDRWAGETVKQLTIEVQGLPALYDAAIGAMADMMCRFTEQC